jgi:hypothetical protein
MLDFFEWFQLFDNLNTADEVVDQDTARFRGARGYAYVIGGASATHARNEL